MRNNQTSHVITFRARGQLQRPAALRHKQPSGIFRAIHYFHTEDGATFTRRSSEAPLLLYFQTNNQNHNNITHLLSSYTMAFRCESDDSDNELTAMQEEVIQPYQLEPVVEARRIDLSLCGGTSFTSRSSGWS